MAIYPWKCPVPVVTAPQEKVGGTFVARRSAPGRENSPNRVPQLSSVAANFPSSHLHHSTHTRTTLKRLEKPPAIKHTHHALFFFPHHRPPAACTLHSDVVVQLYKGVSTLLRLTRPPILPLLPPTLSKHSSAGPAPQRSFSCPARIIRRRIS